MELFEYTVHELVEKLEKQEKNTCNLTSAVLI